MRQLTALDAQFLHVETATTAAHVAGLAVLDPADGAVDRDSLAALLLARLHLSPALSLRLAEVPLGLDLPYWIADPAFDIGHHLFELTLPAPGDDRLLAEAVAEIHARRLDRTRPLWEMHLIKGLRGGRVAVYTKVHHAAIDGVSGAETLAALLDLTPDGHLPPDGIGQGRPSPPPASRTGRRQEAKAGMATKAGVRPEAGAAPDAPARPKAGAAPGTNARPEAGAAPRAGVRPEAGAAPGAGVRPEAGAALGAGARPETGARPESAATPKAGTGVEVVPVTDAGPGTGVEVVPVADAGPEAGVRGIAVAGPGAKPGVVGMLAAAVLHGATQPLRAARSVMRAAEDLDAIPLAAGLPGAKLIARAARAVSGDRQHRPELPSLAVPRTPFNGPISARRHLSFGSLPLKDVKQVAKANGISVNDVVMTLCASALRSWLRERDALPDEPLIVAVPVAVRRPGGKDLVGNQISAMVAPVPTNVPDPKERLRVMGAVMGRAKRRFALAPATWPSELCSLLPAPVTSLATPAIFRLAGMAFPPVNLIVSNVPGPQFPLYLCGGRVLSYYPLSVLTDVSGGLTITCFSYDGMLDFGIVACPELVDDVWSLLGHLRTALDELSDERVGDEFRDGVGVDLVAG
ncbi:wax ester/triacylglycerol synthase domain-containing protein [Nonomuraea sp. NPDC049421]|uniref:wax ester/triacylglycerol synthase domain-containing protein n=1 Tax=Nonomuraea sp. NPDC049421 TaxID=3155275 RepID=UPI0034205A5C